MSGERDNKILYALRDVEKAYGFCPKDEQLYAEAGYFIKQEDDCTFTIGCADFRMVSALVYAVELARCCCGAPRDRIPVALKLAKLLTNELKAVKASLDA